VRVPKGRIAVPVAAVAVVAVAWAPAPVASHYADGAGGAEAGLVRIDRGWEFVYHAVRLSRGAELGTGGAAMERAETVWASRPKAESVDLRYLDGPFTVPVPAGGAVPRNPTARPRDRLAWVVEGHMGDGPRQMIGLLDYKSGDVVWKLRQRTGPR
jgi:hypothetical protein